MGVVIFQKYGKIWNGSLELFIKHKPLIFLKSGQARQAEIKPFKNFFQENVNNKCDAHQTREYFILK